ncbi:5-carboxymethyl-2-hydroxymuconate Delta-isomerase [uncultured Cohaesibacter sp.]|uniref:5-carboxymethyl-2-hydroxymuconate Delta-isomerase n=1 Tax=uncultured Cohaesibacter sp. TaxID=1002546 RepID=UPI00292EADF3|nr:5-carboxymethyl-2-hydroxymuconate Delta-isomerase [uncultured Cohaesibacter sp.]
MPHLVISYAKTLESEMEIKPLVQTVWQAAEKSGLFTPKAIKARALPFDDYVTGGTDQTFIHVEVRLFAGRTEEQKAALVKGIYDAMKAAVSPDISLSVEARDMNKATYIKD